MARTFVMAAVAVVAGTGVAHADEASDAAAAYWQTQSPELAREAAEAMVRAERADDAAAYFWLLLNSPGVTPDEVGRVRAAITALYWDGVGAFGVGDGGDSASPHPNPAPASRGEGTMQAGEGAGNEAPEQVEHVEHVDDPAFRTPSPRSRGPSAIDEPERPWYGWQVGLVDAVGLACIAGGIAADEGGPALLGSIVLIVGIPTVHHVHDRAGYGWGTLALRGLGALLGAAAGEGGGAVGGYVIAAAIDIAFVARENPPDEPGAVAQRDGLYPIVAAGSSYGMAGVGGSF